MAPGREMVGVGRPTGGCGSTDSGFRGPVLCCTHPPQCPCQCGRQQRHMCADASRTDREARGRHMAGACTAVGLAHARTKNVAYVRNGVRTRVSARYIHGDHDPARRLPDHAWFVNTRARACTAKNLINIASTNASERHSQRTHKPYLGPSRSLWSCRRGRT